MQRNLAAALAEIPKNRGAPAPVISLAANDAPLPLKRAMRKADAYPVDALGSIMSAAVEATADIHSIPNELCAQSALANAALAVQGHANAVKPWSGKPGPISLFLLSVAESGDRKTTADEALGGDAIEIHEQAREAETYANRMRYNNEFEAYEMAKSAAKAKASKCGGGAKAIASALNDIGEPPVAPLTPTLTFGDPTIEGLHKHFLTGQPSAGLFSSEGGAFVGGVGMSPDNALKTAAQFSDLWDGKAIKRMRSGDGVLVLRNRRLCFHLMMQPRAAHQWLSNAQLRDQGLFSRLLVAAPKSLAGTRFHRQPSAAARSRMQAYNAHLSALLDHPLPVVDERGELQPRPLPLSDSARALLEGFGDSVEAQVGDGGGLCPVKGLAGRASDHAVRLASVVGLFENLSLAAINGSLMARGIKLANWYLGEALRLTEAEAFPPDLLNAERVLEWLKGNTEGDLFSLPCVYMRGPNAVRTKDAAKRAVAILVEHRQIESVDGRHSIKGLMRSECYRLRGEA